MTNIVCLYPDTFIIAINGITIYNDSELIFRIFQKQDTAGIRTLLHRLKIRSDEFGESPDSAIPFLFDKLSANHREELKDLLITQNVTEDLVSIVIGDILSPPVSEEEKAHQMSNRIQVGGGPSPEERHVNNNEQLHSWLMRFHGSALDDLLLELEKQSGKSQQQTVRFVFENLDTLPAENVRDHFYTNSTPRAAEYALEWTAIRINNLLVGYTGILDSGSVVWNFKKTPVNLRALVLERLNKGDSPDIASRLMQKLQPEDYAELQKRGLRLPKNTNKETLLDRTLEAGEWLVIATQVMAGGLVGVVSGVVALGWDIFAGIVDIPTGVYHYFMTMLFLSSKGSIGSDSVLKVEEYIQSVEGFAGDPRAVIEMAYEQTMEESQAFEGTLEAFDRTEYWTRMTIKFIGTVIAIVGGVRAARTGLPAKENFVLKHTGRIDDAMKEILINSRKGKSNPITVGKYKEFRELMKGPRAGMAREFMPSPFNLLGLKHNCLQCNLRAALKLYGKEMELKGPAKWKSRSEEDLIMEKSTNIDPSIVKKVKNSAIKTTENKKKGYEYFKLTKYDAYIKYELTVVDEDIYDFLKANGLKPSTTKTYENISYESLLKKLLEQKHDAIVSKKGQGGTSSHIFLFRGGRYDKDRYFDFYDAQRNIEDYPSTPKHRSRVEKFDVWFLDSE